MAGEVMLGISPGTRVMGLAILHNGELLEWKVKTFKNAWSKTKQKKILAVIARLCSLYNVTAIGIKKVDPIRSSPHLDKLIIAILIQSNLVGIRVHQFSLSDLDYDLQTGQKQTKDTLSKQIATKHPELEKKYLQERSNRTEYYTKMFEAIAIAEQCRGI